MLDYVEKEYECIDGREIMMSPANTKHLRIQGNFYCILRNYLNRKRCEVFSEHRVVLEEKTWLQPDLLVVCDPSKIKRTCIEGTPDFIVEILSLATQNRDLGIKKDLYEKYGVKEYWVIDPKKESVTVFLLKEDRYVLDHIYQNFTEEEWGDLTEEEKEEQRLFLKLSLYDDLEISLKEIFATPEYGM